MQEDATTKRGDLLLRMKLGSAPVEVYREPVEQFDLKVAATRDKKYIQLDIDATDTSEVRLLPADQPEGAFQSVLGREKGHRYRVEHRNGELFIRTNKDAKNFRVVSAPASAPTQTGRSWSGTMARCWCKASRCSATTWSSPKRPMHSIASASMTSTRRPGRTSSSTIRCTWRWAWVHPEFSAGAYRLSYQSPVTPPTIIDVDMASGARTVLKREEVVGGYDPKRYVTKRLWATARDGVKVPLWTVYRKGTRFDGSAPLLLYSYGSYGYSTEAAFASSRISLLERGVVYVQAHIRGGTDMGEHWHDDGMLMKKKNTFNDFIDSADYLVQQKWTRPDRLIIQGGSAGGLLMGAVVNMRPDLFHAVHAAVPFVDVMNTMMDASLPLTTGEYLEWGDPNQKAAYDYMRSYSPYDNIERKHYPAMLVTTGLNDSQVMYWEPAKYVAKLRAYKTDNNSLLLKTNMGAGHGGASGRYDAIREGAFNMAWMLSQWGIKE